ncbi:glycoside hydrolase family 97 protein [Rhodothermus marinus]|uniref:Putative alpha-glucosidase n=1 Tax=Rhodothermus marinus (strain ATCC 43812 / DSM 4252 / R-10) TaxID=518766 RepID=D0ME47_RHOM4|nr:glycoside hydrolase family 97 protein [Rhodothermus marinus]ACY47271.1 putative alpha-glucosidase [Rhodothermus marinus DSM 4252]
MRRFLPVLLLIVSLAAGARAQTASVASLDGSLVVSFTLEDGRPTYRIDRFGLPLILPSRMGFELQEQPPLVGPFRLIGVARDTVDTIWTQPWGEKKDIRSHYHELRLQLEETSERPRRMDIVFRVFDEGVGFRYEWPAQPNLDRFVIMDELTEFRLAGDHMAWWIPAYHPNRYEYLYRHTPVSQLDTVHTPVTMETADGWFLSFHEADVEDYATMTLAPKDSLTLEVDLVPWSDGTRVRAQTPFRSPWRVLLVGDDAGELITNYTILNLNPPNRLGDVSWVRPAKYVGIWWEMHIGRSTWGSGPRHGATTENAKRYIDFAARHGFDAVLIEGWNVGWDGDWTQNGDKFRFTEPYPDFDIEEVARYAREKGVQLIGHHETACHITNYERQMEDAFAFYRRLGIHMVKTGYVAHGRNCVWIDEQGREHREWHHGQFMVRHHRRVLETAARYQIAINAHEPVKDTGERRTYPNMVSREGARGQEYNAWSEDGGNPPEHTTILPFTRLLAGPMDFTPGIFDILIEDRPNNRVNTTLAKQLALYVVIYSPLQMAADLPEHYEARPDAFQFIKDVPVDWEDTRVLHARIGDYVTIVRKDRHSDDWYLGSITDEYGRTLQAPLSFLEPGRKYVAEIYRDAPDADWRTNPLAIEITRQIVDASTVLTLRLAPGGGTAIRFHPVEE